MKERIYQGVIAILVVSLAVVFYNSYSNDASTQKNPRIATGVDISKSKPSYKDIDPKKLLDNRQRENKLEKMKLNSSLADLRTSEQKSLQMIKEYNQQHPNNPITFNVDSYKATSYDFDQVHAKVSLEQIQQRLHNLNNKIAIANSAATNKFQTSRSSENKSYTTNTSTTQGTTTSSLKTQTLPSGKEVANSSKTSLDAQTDTDTKQVDPKVLAYQTSINEIAKVIEKINKNLE